MDIAYAGAFLKHDRFVRVFGRPAHCGGRRSGGDLRQPLPRPEHRGAEHDRLARHRRRGNGERLCVGTHREPRNAELWPRTPPAGPDTSCAGVARNDGKVLRALLNPPSISAFGWPAAPNPPIRMVEPSLTPCSASATERTTLLIMRRIRRSPRGGGRAV
jgi:hypothetical protein